jgi:DNA-binding PadR family transcriptional regulator
MPRRRNSSRQALRLFEALVTSGAEWRHGYDISRETGLKSGTLYPLLMRLEAQQLLETRWGESLRRGLPPRHLYRLTDIGVAEATKLLSEVSRASNSVAAGHAPLGVTSSVMST